MLLSLLFLDIVHMYDGVVFKLIFIYGKVFNELHIWNFEKQAETILH